MRLTINGQDQKFASTMTVETLLVKMGVDPKKVAVERNLEIVAKGDYNLINLENGDRIEIVQFIGGGSQAS